MSVIPATWEAEAGELLECGGAEVAVSRDSATALQPGACHRVPLSQKKKVCHDNEVLTELTSLSSWLS